MIIFLIKTIFSSVYALDIGSNNIVLAVGTPGKGVSVKPTLRGFRSHPNFFGYLDTNPNNFTETNWLYGIDASAIKDSTKVVKNPFEYLLKPNEFPIKEIHPITACSLAISLFLESTLTKQDRLILSVPSFSLPQYRFALHQSMKHVSKGSVQIVNQNSALLALYLIERYNKSTKGDFQVLIVDIGSSHTEICLWSIHSIGTSISANLIDFRYDEFINGDNLDQLISIEVFKRIKYSLNIQEKNIIKERIIKSKENLASGGDFILDLKDITGEIIKIDLEIIYKSTLEIIKRFDNLLLEFNCNPNEIEIFGGSSRYIPFTELLLMRFENSTVKRSLNSDDSVALGAAYIGSLQTKLMSGLSLKILQNSTYGFIMKKKYKEIKLIEKESKYTKHVISFTEKKDFDFKLNIHLLPLSKTKINFKNKEISNKFLKVFVNGISKIKETWSEKLFNEEFLINITFNEMNEFGSLGILNGKILNQVYLGKKEPSIKLWPAELKILLNEKILNEPDENLYIKFIQFIKSQKTSQANQHQFDSFYYETLLLIENDTNFKLVTTELERNTIKYLLKEIKFLDKKDYEKNKSLFETLQEKLKDPLFRYEELNERNNSIEILNNLIKKSEELILKNPNDRQYLVFKDYLEITKQWKDTIISQPLLENPNITNKDIIKRTNILQNKIDQLNKSKDDNSELGL